MKVVTSGGRALLQNNNNNSIDNNDDKSSDFLVPSIDMPGTVLSTFHALPFIHEIP